MNFPSSKCPPSNSTPAPLSGSVSSPSASSGYVDLDSLFGQINDTHFDGFLELIDLSWNSRLRSSAGRFFPGSRKYILQMPPRIEIASYLKDEQNAVHWIWDTLAHEMIHYWLWVRRRPYGHTPEFHAKMNQMGVSRYNRVPRHRPFRYLYGCPHCQKEFPSKKKLGVLACLQCCNALSGGRFDIRFKLVLLRALDPAEGHELLRQRLASQV